MARFGSARTWWRVALAVVALAAVAGAVVLLVLRLRPQPAPTVGGSRAQGTLSSPDVSGARTYDNPKLRFRVRVPGAWSVRETDAAQEMEGDYLTLAFLPKSSSGTLSPPKLEVVPDPQGFKVDDVVRMKWGTADSTLTIESSTVEAAGSRGVEVRASSRPGAKPLYTYEALTIVAGRLFLMRFTTIDRAEFDAVAAEAKRVFTSLETY